MGRQADRKEETRRSLIEAASRNFREHGFDGVGVDSIAKDAGATSGAFYAHLGSKDAAFLAALEHGLDEVITAVPEFQDQHGEGWVEAFATYYVGKAHRDDLACGCAMTAMSPDVVRASPDARMLYEERMMRIVDLMAAGLTGGAIAKRRARAWSILQTLIGGLTTSRAVHTPELASRIASAAKRAAIRLATEDD